MSRLALCLAVLVLVSSAASAQDLFPGDDLLCYAIRSPLEVEGLVDVESVQFGLEEGCKLKDPKYFCVPAVSEEGRVRVEGEPVVPSPIFEDELGGVDRVCYRVKCPERSVPRQDASDRFAARSLRKMKKAKLLCVPAIKHARCGNGVVEEGEDCDDGGNRDGDGCAADCRLEDRMCGGIRGLVCDEGELCRFEPGECEVSDRAGTCTEIPDACTREFRPVCGCDGRTYGNECEALSAGISVDHTGECERTRPER